MPGRLVIGTGKRCLYHREVWVGTLEVNTAIRYLVTPKELLERRDLIIGDNEAWLNAAVTLLQVWKRNRLYPHPRDIRLMAKVLCEAAQLSLREEILGGKV